MCFSLASKMVPACACVCGGRVMAYKVRLHLKNKKRCHPIGYGFERLDSKLGWGRFFFFFFFEKMARGVGGRLFVGGYYFKYFPQRGARAITRGRRLIEGRLLLEEMLHT